MRTKLVTRRRDRRMLPGVLTLRAAALLAALGAFTVACSGTYGEETPVVVAGGDAGTDAGTEGAATDASSLLRLRVDLAETEFPPLVRKLGINGEWNERDPNDILAAKSAGEVFAPLADGLFETKSSTTDFGATSCFGPNALFSRVDGSVNTRTDGDLTKLRRAVKDAKMMNLLQLAGTPIEQGVFTVDPSLTRPSGGNFYPLPPKGSPQIAEMANAFASFARDVAADGLPTIWSFWQEPDHTIGGNLSREQSLGRYLELFSLVGPALRGIDRDFVVAGVQQNAAAGMSAGGVIDGADYKVWSSMLLAFEKQRGAPLPLDYITIQNYQSDQTRQILGNARIAYADARFATSPFLMNEWDFALDGSKDADFAAKYDTSAGVIQFLNALHPSLDAPDVAYLLLTRNVFAHKPRAFEIVRFLGGMSEHRRVVPLSAAPPSVHGLASADHEVASVLLWNDGPTTASVDLELANLAPELVGKALSLTTMTAAAPAPARTVLLAASDAVVPNVVIPPLGVVMASVGARLPATGLTVAKLARPRNWLDRASASAVTAPSGMGHYDVQSSSLVVGASGPAGRGLAGVVLKDVPAAGYVLDAKLSTSGMDVPSNTTVLGLRVDYLDGAATLRSVFHRSGSFAGSDPWSAFPTWQPLADEQIETVVLTDGAHLAIDVATHAPAGWAAADGGSRRLLVSLVLVAPGSKATVKATLTDGP